MTLHFDRHDLDELWRAKSDYDCRLQRVFDPMTPAELAEISFRRTNPAGFVDDYIHRCKPAIRETYEAARAALLEQRAQSRP